jgi:hypothetical protein
MAVIAQLITGSEFDAHGCPIPDMDAVTIPDPGSDGHPDTYGYTNSYPYRHLDTD